VSYYYNQLLVVKEEEVDSFPSVSWQGSADFWATLLFPLMTRDETGVY